MIRIELFGVPSLRAGARHLDLEAATAGDAMRALAEAFPTLVGSVLQGAWPHPAYRLSLNGERFIERPDEPMADGDALILLAADAGG